MSILPLHRPTRRAAQRGRIVSNVEVPTLPTEVWTNLFTVDRSPAPLALEAHRGDGRASTGCNRTLCGLALIGTVWLAAHRNPLWCTRCWPGLRCEVCGAPSGGHTECGACLPASIDEDKQIERGLS